MEEKMIPNYEVKLGIVVLIVLLCYLIYRDNKLRRKLKRLKRKG